MRCALEFGLNPIFVRPLTTNNTEINERQFLQYVIQATQHQFQLVDDTLENYMAARNQDPTIFVGFNSLQHCGTEWTRRLIPGDRVYYHGHHPSIIKASQKILSIKELQDISVKHEHLVISLQGDNTTHSETYPAWMAYKTKNLTRDTMANADSYFVDQTGHISIM